MICKLCEGEYGDLSQNIGTCRDCLTSIILSSVPNDDPEDEGSDIDNLLDDEEDEEGESCRNCGEVPDECSCGPRDEDDAAPEECDYVTKDDASCSLMKFHEYGTGKKLLFVNPDKENWIEAVKAHMDKEQFWPSVWFLSDHGNWHLLRLSDG